MYPPYLLALTHFPSPLLQCSLSSRERDLMETSHLYRTAPRSFILCVMSNYGSSYLFPSAARGSFLVNCSLCILAPILASVQVCHIPLSYIVILLVLREFYAASLYHVHLPLLPKLRDATPPPISMLCLLLLKLVYKSVLVLLL